MNIRTFFTSLTILAAGMVSASAQNSSDKVKPQWMHSLPVPTNSTFIYEVVTTTSNNLTDARAKAETTLISDAGFKSGVLVVTDHKSTRTVKQQFVNGKLTETVDRDATTTNTAKGQEIMLHASFIDEYWTRDDAGQYHLHRLYAKSELGKMPLYDNVELTTRYGNDPKVWGMALIPGVAQFYKRSTLKGGLILGGTVTLIGGIIATESMRSDYINKIDKTHNADNKRTYKNRADNMATGRNICIGALGALYVYNIIDAIVAPGARRIITTPACSNEFSFQWAPGMIDGRHIGIAANITF